MAMSHRWLRRPVRSRSALRGEQGSVTIGMRWMISLNGHSMAAIASIALGLEITQRRIRYAATW
jgi:hypothetical protein